MATYFLVCYDVVETRRRNQVAHLLESYGLRVQKSVFECLLEPAQHKLLQQRLQRYLNLQEDQLRFYPISKPNWEKVQVLGWQPDFVVGQRVVIV
jgi:CRISPR-associated protein Cas2